MKVVLFNAVSLDGFIADDSGGTDWVKDTDEWLLAVKDFGCMIIGRKTHEEVGIIQGVRSFIYTHEFKTPTPNTVFVTGTPEEVLQEIHDAGFKKVVLAGGSKTNYAFAQAGLINEVILDVHPLVLGNGKRLLGDYTKALNLKLIFSQSKPKGFVQNRYEVISA